MLSMHDIGVSAENSGIRSNPVTFFWQRHWILNGVVFAVTT